jgi:protein-tyrosine phosphatase
MRILFVCMGNICRSPSAEGVFRSLVAARAPQLSVELDSAGTHDYHVGEPPDERSIAAARRRGIDLSTLRARTVKAGDFDYYDLILAMDEQNLRELRRRAPAQRHDRIRLMMEFVPAATTRAVPDPYYGGPQGFEQVLDLLEEAAEGLLSEMLSRAEARPR